MESYVLGLILGFVLLNAVFFNTMLWRRFRHEKS